MNREETTKALIEGVRGQFDSWAEMAEEVREDFETVASLAAKVAEREAAGDVEWARKQMPHIRSMLADIDSITSGMATRAFWTTVERVGEVLGSVLVGAAKAAL